MTKLLEEAINKINALPENEQNEIATLILDEIAWDKSLDKSREKLSILAERALEYHAKGKTTDLDFNDK